MNICRKRNKKVPLRLVWGGVLSYFLPFEGLKVPALRLSFYIQHINISSITLA